MKLKTICAGIIGLTLGLGSIAYAATSYFVPEHVQCTLDSKNKLSCNDFNRNLLTEHTYTNADFENERNKLFSFFSAVAYFTPEKEWSILFTYKDTKYKNVTLRTVNTSIKPDLKNGSWVKFKDEFYTCDAGYRSCTQ